ncbi:SGNH/GDSL hydrolase family protein [Magnetospirillum aberrantis]|uniref:SGNH/GDSL hydrolase family protein n=1 Tax=Magnetospirillum aberrantis SpK TaxID=908842 RepID=A0A7C9V0F9_9PROT|nr:SGNH/GDSL hydrolase family protein [Magnetospirillum aberrantis]NFV81151.1 SGNH/GDSL hydrolase family protein [Magnetospirillum aberrantis SpK]
MKRLGNLGKVYATTAVIVMNIALLLLGCAFALEWVLDLRHGSGTAVTPSVSLDMASYRDVDATTAQAIAAELDVYASSQPFGFNPWTTFQQLPFAGKYITVQDDPVLTHRKVPTPAGNGPRYVVWAFGGSTMFGWGVDDAHTLPANLQDALQSRMPDRTVEVVNFGQPYWYSSSEVAAFVALLRDRATPDAVVFLDGLNDASWVSSGFQVPVFAGRAEQAWNQARANAKRELPWLTVNSSFPFLRIVDWLRYRGALPPVPTQDHYRNPPTDQTRAIVETYRANRALASDVAKARGIKSFFFIQPVPWAGEWPSGHANTDFPFGDKVQAVRAIETLVSEAQAGRITGFHSLHDALTGIERPFVDGTHYSDAANHRLAQAIADAMAVQ